MGWTPEIIEQPMHMANLIKAVFFLAAGLVSVSVWAAFEEDYEQKKWEELEVQMPPVPRPENLQSFFVSSATDNLFAVDLPSISVGTDGVVRYTLEIKTSGGARNVTYEGIRCQTRERRIYASGRRDGTWSKARNSEWQKIQDVPANRYHAALFLEYFCPWGVIVNSVDEAREALRRGIHPTMQRN